MEKTDNQFTATCQVTSNVPDEQRSFRDLGLHNINTEKDYKTRAWFNVLNKEQKTFLANIKVGEKHKFTIERKLKEYNGKTTTFFNIVGVDIPDQDINEDMKSKTKETKSDQFSYKETTSLFQTKLNGACNMWCAMASAGKEMDLSMIDDYYDYLANFQKQKLEEQIPY